jgi:hypothetical protein
MTLNWAQVAIDSLRRGETCTLIPHGNSMRPRIFSGATVTLVPLAGPLSVQDVVLVDIPGTAETLGHTTLHRVLGVCDDVSETVLIGDLRGNIDGWVDVSAIHGRVVSIANPEPRVPR